MIVDGNIMSDVSSSLGNHSTDSEESFLVQQINKSQLFDSSSSSSNSSKRRSFFRESYIDDRGVDRSFSVLRDVILENDETTDLSNVSGLSSLDAEKLRNNNSRGSILNEVDLNKPLHPVEVLPQKIKSVTTKSISRKESPPDAIIEEARPVSIQEGNKLSLNLLSTKASSKGSKRSSTQSGSTKIRDTPVSQPPQLDIIPIHYNENKSDTEISRPIQSDSIAPQKPFKLLSKPLEKDRSSSNSSSKTSRSAASDFSGRTSLLNFELTRKKQAGTPHLLLQPSDSDPIYPTPVNSLSSKSPHLESKSAQFSQGPRIQKSGIPFKKECEIPEPIRIYKPQEPEPFQYNSASSSEEDLTEEKRDPYYANSNSEKYPHHNDELLEKIHYYRKQPMINPQRDSTGLVWMIYLISFIVPPLFFFFGLGLLDRYMIPHKIGPEMKKLSLITGIIVLIISLAMIGVGFGYGIHASSQR